MLLNRMHILIAKFKNAECKIPDITNWATNASPNVEINQVKQNA